MTIDLVLLKAEEKSSVFIFYFKPLKPCKLGIVTEVVYTMNLSESIAVAGPISALAEAIVPLTLVIDASKNNNFMMTTVRPFRFCLYNWGIKEVMTVGELLDEARKFICVSAKSSLP